jgi:hypothetical protein
MDASTDTVDGNRPVDGPPRHRGAGALSALALTGRLWWRHWPQLVLLVLVRVLAGRFLIDGAVEVGLHNRLLGLCALSVPVLIDLLVFVAMFHVLKPSLPLLGRPGGALPIQVSVEARREPFLDGLTLVLVPFFAYYAAWGLLGDTVRRYSLRALERMDPFTQHGSILDVLGAPGLIAVVAVTWLVRRGLKALDARRHRAVWKLLITLCEATWLFIGLFVFNAWKGRAVEWWHTRAAHGWWDALVQWSGLSAVLAASLTRGLAALRDVALYAALPLVWLAMTALVYGRELGRAEELAAADSRLGRFAARYRRLPASVHRSAEHLVQGYRKRFVPIIHSVRLVLAAGLPLLVFVAVGYRALGWLSLWAWIGLTHLIGPHSLEAWQVIASVLGLVLVGPLQTTPSLIVEPLRICLLAAVLETAVAAASVRDRSAAPQS